MSQHPDPSDMELRILRVLWDRGPSTVAEVKEWLEEGKNTRGYTSYLKHLQIMHEKGLVDRDESSRAHVYSAAVAENEVQRNLVRDVLDKAFAGSAVKLVMRALTVEDLTREERAEIREMLEREGE